VTVCAESFEWTGADVLAMARRIGKLIPEEFPGDNEMTIVD
jgi:hypothetical protein